MPQISPILLTLPKQKKIRFSTYKNIRGPKSFVDCLKHDQWSEVKKGIDDLVNKGIYQPQESHYYWYRLTTEKRVFEGFICGVHLERKRKVITTHEDVMPERVQLFSDYLSTVNRQAEPLLLMHENPAFSSKMGKSNYKKAPDFEFREESKIHQLWVLSSFQSKKLENFTKNIDQFHLADGHHRLASTQKWAVQHQEKGVALAFVMASNQLYNGAFFWAIKTTPLPKSLKSRLIEYDRSLPLYLKTKDKLFSISSPADKHPLIFLYEQILRPSNIDICYFPEGTSSIKLLKQFSGVFGYKALRMEEIIALAKKGHHLPPKSTYLHPKLPTGLFIAPLSTN